MISPKLVEVGRHINIDLLTNSELVELKGEPGNFTAVVRKNPRYVDLAKCTSCGECTKVCPIETANDYDEGLSQRKAIYKASRRRSRMPLRLIKLEWPHAGMPAPFTSAPRVIPP